MHATMVTTIQGFECCHVRASRTACELRILAFVECTGFAFGGGRHRHGLHQHTQSDAGARRRV